MQFHRGTGCHIILLGILLETPTIMMSEKGDLIATLSIQVIGKNNQKQEYTVVTYEEKALTMRRYGFPGLHLWIEGSLQTNNNSHSIGTNMFILAEKVEFLSSEKSGMPEAPNYKQTVSRKPVTSNRIHH